MRSLQQCKGLVHRSTVRIDGELCNQLKRFGVRAKFEELDGGRSDPRVLVVQTVEGSLLTNVRKRLFGGTVTGDGLQCARSDASVGILGQLLNQVDLPAEILLVERSLGGVA